MLVRSLAILLPYFPLPLSLSLSLSLSLALCLSVGTFSSPEVLLTRKLDFDQIVLLILTVSWVTLIIGICLEYLAPKKSGKKKKKGGGGGGGGGVTAGPGGESNKVKYQMYMYMLFYVSLIL